MSVNFDLERMKKAVSGKFVTVPNGITRDQFLEWMKAQAEEIKCRSKA